MTGDTVTNSQGWRPTETAPKDGTRVLLYPCTTGPHHKGKAVVGYGYWHQPGNPERMGFWMHAFNGSKRANLTHWMPIPAPDSITIPQAEYARLVDENRELNHLFKLRHAADMRAIKRWREGHPERDLRQPDHADMVVWLIESNYHSEVLEGLLTLTEKMFNLLKKTADSGLTKMSPEGLEFEDLVFVRKARAALKAAREK